MTLHRTSAMALAILVLTFASQVSGAIVVYDESINGDLPQSGSPLPIMALDVGTNTVKGRSGADIDDVFDFDGFAFTVPSGAQLVLGSVSIVDSLGNVGDFGGLSWGLYSGSPNSYVGSLLEFPAASSPGSYTFTTTPLASNVYNISPFSGGHGGGEPAFGDYTFTLVVTSLAPVPEPATLMIWGLVLAGVPVGAKAWRKFVAAQA